MKEDRFSLLGIARIFSLITCLAFVMVACSDKEYEADPLLDGLVFSHYEGGGETAIVPYPPSDNIEFFQNFILSPIAGKDICSGGSVDAEELQTIYCPERKIASTMRFKGATCVLEQKGNEVLNSVYRKYKRYTYTFKEGSHQIDDYTTMVVKANLVTISSKDGDWEPSWKLDNFQAVLTTWGELYEKSENRLIESLVKYEYKRDGDNIVFTNKDSQLVGLINQETMELLLAQQLPTENIIGSFRLQ